MPAKKPGERRQQILQTVAVMLENPLNEKITTAALAEKLDFSEAALYRHFASKAQIYEALIEYIETSLFSLFNKITSESIDGLQQAHQMVSLLLAFAEKNPGLTRLLIGDVLVYENPRLQIRINQLLDRLEAAIKQSFRLIASQDPNRLDPSAHANLVLAYILGRWQLFVKTTYQRKPLEGWETQSGFLLG